MANLKTITKKEQELTAAQKKKLKAQLEKKGFTGKKLASALKKPYLYSNSAGKEPSAAVAAALAKLTIGDELDSSGMSDSYTWKGKKR